MDVNFDQDSINILNELNHKQLDNFLTRVCFCLSTNRQTFFSTEEEEKFQKLLNVDSNQLVSLLHTISKIFLQAHKHGSHWNILKQILQLNGIKEEHFNSFNLHWTTYQYDFRNTKQKNLNTELKNVTTELHLETASNCTAKQKVPIAFYELLLAPGSRHTPFDQINFQMSYEQMQIFYQELEKIAADFNSIK